GFPRVGPLTPAFTPPAAGAPGGATGSVRRDPPGRAFKSLMNSDPRAADTVISPPQEPRLPPGQVRTDKWPVLQYGSVPSVDLATWDFRVYGLVEKPARWTWEE